MWGKEDANDVRSIESGCFEVRGEFDGDAVAVSASREEEKQDAAAVELLLPATAALRGPKNGCRHGQDFERDRPVLSHG